MRTRGAARKRTTLTSVARDAGVSLTTASLILTNRDGWIDQFRPETVQRVRSSAQRLGYCRNLLASGLLSGESPFFAVVLNEPSCDESDWSHPYLQGSLLAGVRAAAEQQGVYAIVTSARDNGTDGETLKISQIVDGGVCGAIFQSPTTTMQQIIQDQLERRSPTVVLFPDQLSAWPTHAIDLDNHRAGQLAGRLLLARKRTRWGLIRFEQVTDAQRMRAEGFEKLAQDAGVEVDPIVIPEKCESASLAAHIASSLWQHRHDALYAVDPLCSVAAVLACMRMGIDPGNECCIVGSEASHWNLPGLPAITSIDVSWRQVGILAVQHLLEARSTRRRMRTLLMKPCVIEGDTCLVAPRFNPLPRLSAWARPHPLIKAAV